MMLDRVDRLMQAHPEILNHNVETVPRLFKTIQPQDSYDWAAATLSNAKKLDPDVLTKSGIMVGLGEELEEVKAVMRDQLLHMMPTHDHPAALAIGVAEHRFGGDDSF